MTTLLILTVSSAVFLVTMLVLQKVFVQTTMQVAETMRGLVAEVSTVMNNTVRETVEGVAKIVVRETIGSPDQIPEQVDQPSGLEPSWAGWGEGDSLDPTDEYIRDSISMESKDRVAGINEFPLIADLSGEEFK